MWKEKEAKCDETHACAIASHFTCHSKKNYKHIHVQTIGLLKIHFSTSLISQFNVSSVNVAEQL